VALTDVSAAERLTGYGVEPVVASTWLLRHDAGVVLGARLDRLALSQWCLQRLGSEPEEVLFEAGYLSQVIGLRLTDGRDVVVSQAANGHRAGDTPKASQPRGGRKYSSPPAWCPTRHYGQLTRLRRRCTTYKSIRSIPLRGRAALLTYMTVATRQ
jgi:hypothetical protein